MLKMSQYELIKTAYRVYGKSIRNIAKEFGHSRKTVRKALRDVRPAYHRKEVPVSPVMDTYRKVILEWLRSDLNAPRKQRHTARRIYCRLG
jgi:transposase